MDPDNPECPPQSQSLYWSHRHEVNRDRAVEAPESTVMSAFDGSGADRQFVIADTARDDAWMSVTADENLALTEWC